MTHEKSASEYDSRLAIMTRLARAGFENVGPLQLRL